MKKLLYLALIVATAFGFTSCEDDTTETPEVESSTINYSGDMVVTWNGTPLSSSSDVSYSTLTENDSITVSLNGVQFVSIMPSLDIVLPNIPEITTNYYEADNVTPTTVDGEPYDTTTIKSIDNVIVAVTDSILAVTFECTVSTDAMGDLVCDVTYTGVVAE